MCVVYTGPGPLCVKCEPKPKEFSSCVVFVDRSVRSFVRCLTLPFRLFCIPLNMDTHTPVPSSLHQPTAITQPATPPFYSTQNHIDSTDTSLSFRPRASRPPPSTLPRESRRPRSPPPPPPPRSKSTSSRSPPTTVVSISVALSIVPKPVFKGVARIWVWTRSLLCILFWSWVWVFVSCGGACGHPCRPPEFIIQSSTYNYQRTRARTGG